ncbi:hypothetical protein, conserved [Eimeria brunetti]|uniref:Uncharacterized protein n=1 Tax=Eimeria brunetti TaxID=51314 RepID=U6LPN2_9EIME|nr:hypothetical protein, conserved [Eimeria brunetti]
MSINRTDEGRGSCQRDEGEDKAAPGKRQGLGRSGKEAEVKEDSPSEKQRTAKLREVPRSAGPADEEWGAGICPTSRKPRRTDGGTRQPHLQQQTETEIRDAQSYKGEQLRR